MRFPSLPKPWEAEERAPGLPMQILEEAMWPSISWVYGFGRIRILGFGASVPSTIVISIDSRGFSSHTAIQAG